MKDDIFNYFTTDNISGKKCTQKWLYKNNIKLCDDILNWCNMFDILRNIEFKRKVYHYVNVAKIIPTCLKCKKEVKYKRLRDGYQLYCTSKCKYSCEIAQNKWLESWKNGNSNNEHVKCRNNTIIERYGSLEKYKKYTNYKKVESCLKKYGVEYITQTDSYKEKRKNTLREKYGSETYNNPNKTKETRINNGTQIDDSIIDDFLIFKKVTVNKTYTIYRNNKILINPYNLKRGIKSYHIDHKFSIKQSFLLNIPIEIITHPCNLEMIYYKDNLIKQDNCSIEINELLKNIIDFNYELKFTNKELKEKYSNIKSIALKLLS